jgi:septum formation protein
MNVPLRLVLASASPRRLELVGLLGIPVTCEPADIDERCLPGEPPGCHVLRVARAKADRVARGHPESPVLGADTTVVVGDRILGKPRDRVEARAMLALLSGKTHVVLTGMCLLWRDQEASHLEATSVTFRRLDGALIDWCLAGGEGDDKAGAYALQGLAGALITRVEGNVQAVIGLPLAPLLELLAKVGIQITGAGAALALAVKD